MSYILIKGEHEANKLRKKTSGQLLTVIPSFAMAGITIAGASAVRNQAFSAVKGMYEIKFATVTAKTCAKMAFLG